MSISCCLLCFFIVRRRCQCLYCHSCHCHCCLRNRSLNLSKETTETIRSSNNQGKFQQDSFVNGYGCWGCGCVPGDPPPECGAWRPPRTDPTISPLGVGLQTPPPQDRPSTSPTRVWAWRPAVHAGIPPPL